MSTPASPASPTGGARRLHRLAARFVPRRTAALALAAILGLGALAGAGGAVLGAVGSHDSSEMHGDHHPRGEVNDAENAPLLPRP